MTFDERVVPHRVVAVPRSSNPRLPPVKTYHGCVKPKPLQGQVERSESESPALGIANMEGMGMPSQRFTTNPQGRTKSTNFRLEIYHQFQA